MNRPTDIEPRGDATGWEHGSHTAFVDYYRQASSTRDAVRRSEAIRDAVLRVLERAGVRPEVGLDVADIGCGPGAQSAVWLERGHRVFGLDVSEAFIAIARERLGAHPGARFDLGTATGLPWTDSSMDVCLMPELLEHIADWQRALAECVRVLRPGGALFLSTTNRLCPRQNEFRLPLYSWYPARVKRHYERLAVTSWPWLANYATYPAVNWFSYPELMAEVQHRGFQIFDRFDLAALRGPEGWKGWIIRLLSGVSALRYGGYLASPCSLLVGVKR